MGIEEALAAQPTPMASANKAGVEQVSYYQEIVFTRYTRFVLPADGYVFWIRDALVNPQVLNTYGPNEGPTEGAPVTMTVRGSLHYATDTQQGQEETLAVNRVLFTAESEVENLNAIAPTTLWLGEWDGIRFGFTSRSSFYQQAGLWHYVGDAVYADMRPQIIDDASQFSTLQVVSNSLPIWLSMNKWMPVDYLPFANPALPLYPSFLVPDNITPPFVSIHIDETRALGASPTLGRTLTHMQLATETVTVTLWGVRNDLAMDFVDFVEQFSLTTDLIGLMNMPMMRDEKRVQSDISAIAMKKTVVYKISYYQQSARNLARQLIKHVVPTYYFSN